jgi:hypothetical protein
VSERDSQRSFTDTAHALQPGFDAGDVHAAAFNQGKEVAQFIIATDEVRRRRKLMESDKLRGTGSSDKVDVSAICRNDDVITGCCVG